MSEYQYYEFVALEQPLSRQDVAQLRRISSRADISATRFCNVYNYGDLKADPVKLLKDYFDAFVYDSNFSYRRFLVKVPKRCVTEKQLSTYFVGEHSTYQAAGSDWIIEFCYSDEEGYDDDWWEEESDQWMVSLLGLRAELTKGDCRSLFIVWLAALDNNELPLNAPVPNLPEGMHERSESHYDLCKFLKLDPYIV